MGLDVEQKCMQEIHEIATAAFGSMAEPLSADGLVQSLTLPGASHRLLIGPAQADAIHLVQPVGELDLSHPGLGDFLLREHAQWVFGRLELIDDGLFVQASLLLSQLTPDALRRVVLAVHHMAGKTEDVLTQAGVLRTEEREETDDG